MNRKKSPSPVWKSSWWLLRVRYPAKLLEAAVSYTLLPIWTFTVGLCYGGIRLFSGSVLSVLAYINPFRPARNQGEYGGGDLKKYGWDWEGRV